MQFRKQPKGKHKVAYEENYSEEASYRKEDLETDGRVLVGMCLEFFVLISLVWKHDNVLLFWNNVRSYFGKLV